MTPKEALKELNDFETIISMQDILRIKSNQKSWEKIKKALERANIEHKLLEILFSVCKEYKNTSIGLSDDSVFINVMKELEELK